jgi:hypothetical protein
MSAATASALQTEHPADSEPSRIPEEIAASPKAFRDDEAIAHMAYAYLEDRLKNSPGSTEEDWFRAEQALGF